MPERVALIGLGLMGSGMARNLLRAGFSLTVYNRTGERAAPFAGSGATVAQTPHEAASKTNVIISMVSDDIASRAVWLGSEGALSGARAGSLLVECSTLSPSWVRELAELAARQGCILLDAPVSGSKPQAEAGELAFFVGGDSAALERARPILNAMGKTIHHLGGSGTGATMKLVNNSLSAVEVLVLGEVLTLAERSGLDVNQVATILTNGAPGSTVMKWRAPMMTSHEYITQFAMRLMHKDLTYAMEEAAQQSVPLPSVAAAREIYRLAMARGLGDADFAAVSEALRNEPQVNR